MTGRARAIAVLAVAAALAAGEAVAGGAARIELGSGWSYSLGRADGPALLRGPAPEPTSAPLMTELLGPRFGFTLRHGLGGPLGLDWDVGVSFTLPLGGTETFDLGIGRRLEVLP